MGYRRVYSALNDWCRLARFPNDSFTAAAVMAKTEWWRLRPRKGQCSDEARPSRKDTAGKPNRLALNQMCFPTASNHYALWYQRAISVG